MYKFFLITIILPSFLLANSIPVITQDGINIHLNVSNSHDVEKKDSAQATNQSGDPKPQVIHLIITKKEESFSTKIKNGLIAAGTMGLCTQIPFGKLAELLKTVNMKNIFNR